MDKVRNSRRWTPREATKKVSSLKEIVLIFMVNKKTPVFDRKTRV